MTEIEKLKEELLATQKKLWDIEAVNQKCKRVLEGLQYLSNCDCKSPTCNDCHNSAQFWNEHEQALSDLAKIEGAE